MAENPIATAYVEVRPDTSTFQERLQSDIGGTVRTIGQALATVQIGQFFGEGLREFEGARDAAAQTAAAIQSTGGAANISAEQVGTLADRLGEMAAIDNDIVREGANLLLTFTNIRNEVGEGNNIFDRATESLVDMAAAMGTDAPSAAIQLGKALNDPITGLTSLARAGVQFSEEQKRIIEGFVEAGDVAAAQGVILDELAVQFGGSAEAQASAMDRIAVASGDMKESVGAALAPLLEEAVPLIERAVGVFEAMPLPIQTASLALGGLAVAARPINEMVTLVRTLGDTTGRTSTLLSRLGPAFAASGTAAIGAAVGIGIWQRAIEQGEEQAAEFGEGVREHLASSETYEAFQAGLDTARGSLDGLRRDLEESENWVRHPLQSLVDVDFRRDLDATIEQTEAATAAYERLDPVIQSLAERTGDYDEATRTVLGAQEAVTLALEDGLTPAQAAAVAEADRLATAEAAAATEAAAFGGAAEAAAIPTQTLAEYMADLNDELAELLNISGSLPVVEANFRDSLAAAADEAARLNEEQATSQERLDTFAQMLSRALPNLDDFVQGLLDQGASAEEAAFRTNLMIDELFGLGDEYGVTEQAAADLRTQLGLDYPDVTSTVRLLGLSEALAGLATLEEALRFGFSDVDYNVIRRQEDGGFHAGGVIGAGLPQGTPVMVPAHAGERIDGTWADHGAPGGGIVISPGAVQIVASDSEAAGRAAGRSIRHLVGLASR